MKCTTTRGGPQVSLREALLSGLAPDGGLFVPVQLPTVARRLGSIDEVGTALLTPFFADEGLVASELCTEAMSFPVPLRPLDQDRFLLELFHGPTASFKDFGARFLAAAMRRLLAPEEQRMVLVATSGDTGAAVGDAFAGSSQFSVAILYPRARVSPFQEHHLGSFGGSVRAFRVDGTFDDCQRLVKTAFATPTLRDRLASANSISLGRLLPQVAYYAYASLTLAEQGVAKATYVIPTGNLGNAFAAILAKELGFPLGGIVFATNANRALVDFIATGEYAPRETLKTLANAMDVGAPSNVERLRALYPKLPPWIEAQAVDDETIAARIRQEWKDTGLAACPHTACGLEVASRLREAGREEPLVVVATAHPAKFAEIVEPAIGAAVPPPPSLVQARSRASVMTPLAPTIEALEAALAIS